jgi:hypothetical protein
MNGNSSLPPTPAPSRPWTHIAVHILAVTVGLVSVNVYQTYDLFWLGHPFSVSGYGMALGAMVGGSALGAGGLAWGVSNFIGSSGGTIEGG